jgi:hypothetical protein
MRHGLPSLNCGFAIISLAMVIPQQCAHQAPSRFSNSSANSTMRVLGQPCLCARSAGGAGTPPPPGRVALAHQDAATCEREMPEWQWISA